MEHTLEWLQSIGYDVNHYADDKEVEWKKNYVKLINKN